MMFATDQLRRALDAGVVGAWLGEVRPATGGRASAVLVALSDTHVLLVEKSSRLRRHAGQLAFPGGALDAGESVVDAALREAREEAGLLADDVDVLGTLVATNIPVSGYDVNPVVAHWRTRRELILGDTEIVGIHPMAIADLVEPAHRCWAVHEPSGFKSKAFVVGDAFIWGFTGFILDEIFTHAGWAQPWDESRVLPVPAHRGG